MNITEIIDKHTGVDSECTNKEELKKDLLGLFGVSGSLELLQKERKRLNDSFTVLTPDWMCSKLNRLLHTVWIAEEIIKADNQ